MYVVYIIYTMQKPQQQSSHQTKQEDMVVEQTYIMEIPQRDMRQINATMSGTFLIYLPQWHIQNLSLIHI